MGGDANRPAGEIPRGDSASGGCRRARQQGGMPLKTFTPRVATDLRPSASVASTRRVKLEALCPDQVAPLADPVGEPAATLQEYAIGGVPPGGRAGRGRAPRPPHAAARLAAPGGEPAVTLQEYVIGVVPPVVLAVHEHALLGARLF